MAEVLQFDPELRKKSDWKTIEASQHLAFKITSDLDEARDTTQELLGQGHKPVITIPEEWIGRATSSGIQPIKKA